MLVVQVCHLKDPKHFWEHFHKAEHRLPQGCHILTQLVCKHEKVVWFTWECDSVSHLRQYLDRFITPFCGTEYHELDEHQSDRINHRRAA